MCLTPRYRLTKKQETSMVMFQAPVFQLMPSDPKHKSGHVVSPIATYSRASFICELTVLVFAGRLGWSNAYDKLARKGPHLLTTVYRSRRPSRSPISRPMKRMYSCDGKFTLLFDMECVQGMCTITGYPSRYLCATPWFSRLCFGVFSDGVIVLSRWPLAGEG